jgi:hypothetical protein
MIPAPAPIVRPNGTTQPATQATTHAVQCPYCALGHAVVAVDWRGGAMQIDTKAPRKCGGCGRYFRLGVKVQIAGRRMEEGRP